ncbi:hypothetical protein HGRIS_005313 [Hohenbuehelia grisea]|uniref:Peptidase M43 pregnancy-associated plasma-A domain-containing protein n=1 Tax=Hohenbuehelia grisea TaxID=104357 RepID=A0ABR3JEL8_9AGAR
MMHYTTLFSLLLITPVSVLAGSVIQHMPRGDCSHDERWAKIEASLPSRSNRSIEARGARKSGPLRDVGSNIKVYWHVISAGSTREQGNLPDSEVISWMDILNRDFGPVGLTFELAEIRRIQNSAWFNIPYANGPLEEAMHNYAAPLKDAGSLKVFTHSQNGVSWSAMPESQDHFPTRDGVWLNIASANHTISHEVGHWSGLHHTFYKNECGTGPNDGDMVADTPPQKEAGWVCDKPVYSCGQLQPTDNLMNYMWDDNCRKRFTPGQIQRMHEQLKMYRGITPGTPRQNAAGTKVPESSTMGTKGKYSSTKGTEGKDSLTKGTKGKDPSTKETEGKDSASTGPGRYATGKKTTGTSDTPTESSASSEALGEPTSSASTGSIKGATSTELSSASEPTPSHRRPDSHRPTTGYRRPTSGYRPSRRPVTYQRPTTTDGTDGKEGKEGKEGKDEKDEKEGWQKQANRMLQDIMGELRRLTSSISEKERR